MRRPKRQLEFEIAALKEQLLSQQTMARAREERLRDERGYEQTQRIAAQRGLVPYVRSLEQFDHWLRQNSELREQLAPVLQELGLWEIRLGYDPDKDLSLSAISPSRT